jgi:hypothetical protein
MSKWFRVEDRLPDDGQQVLGYFGEGSMQITYREKIQRTQYWMNTEGAAIDAPTHWQYLPPSPDNSP